MRKVHQNKQKQRIKSIKIKGTSDKTAPKEIQIGYLP
jgi:hypothetical protein